MGLHCFFFLPLVITLFLIAQIAHTADEFLARVTANPAQIKADTEVLATVPQGTRLWVFEVRDDRWVKVKVPGEETKGWLHSSQIQRIERSDADYARLSGASAHFKQYEQLKLERQLPQAIAELRQCLEIERQVLGEDHPNVANSLYLLSNRLFERSLFDEARPVMERALAIRRDMLGMEDIDTIDAMFNLARTYQEQGDLAAARTLFEQTLRLYGKVQGEEHPDTLIAMNSLAIVLHELGDNTAARTLHERALAIRRRVLGQEHPDTIGSMNNLASVLRSLGDLTAARTLFEQSLAIRRKVLGVEHPDTIASMNNLGLMLFDLGDLTNARRLDEQTLELRRKILGVEHPDTLDTMNNLALVLNDLGDKAESRTLHEQTLALMRKVRGAEHPNTLTSMNNLASVLNDLGNGEAARTLQEQTLELRRKTLGEAHPDTLASRNNLAIVLQDIGELAAARTLHKQTLELRCEVLGEGHPHTLGSMHSLAFILARSREVASASDSFDELGHTVRAYLAGALSGLSEREQLLFLKAQDENRFHNSLSFGLQQRTEPRTREHSAAWLLNGKAVTQESLSEQIRLVRESDDPALTVRLEELNSLRTQLASLSLKVVTPEQIEGHQNTLKSIREQEARLSRELGQQGLDVERPEKWVELAEVRERLANSRLLIDIARFRVMDFETGKSRAAHYVAWVIPPAGSGDVQIVDLGEAEAIDAAVAAARTALNEGPQQLGALGPEEAENAVQEPLRKLAELVLDPLLVEVGDAKELILSPDASLWLVPWAALPLDDGRYAVEEYQIRYVVSGRDLVAKPSKVQANGSPVIVADPNFDLTPSADDTAIVANDSGRSRFVGSYEDLANVERLPGTATEAKAITPLLEQYADAAPVVHLDNEATESVVKQLRSPPVLVLSTHGFFLEDQQIEIEETLSTGEVRKVALTIDGKLAENPLLRCGLLLAGSNKRDEAGDALDDGVLTGMEIVGTDLRGTKLVVLSACETGLGQVHNGEGVAGLRQAFQLAGAESVLSTLWQVPDSETAILMEDFFKNLVAGQSKAEALRNAQLFSLSLNRRHHNTGHPYLWAAFTLTGGQ
ncbi:MAG: tetratricopeptide repeat protein [Planctomycetaceae bacterium]|nr:tetratricopeptide repeat protein [Planctomycetaceae bacterium]